MHPMIKHTLDAVAGIAAVAGVILTAIIPTIASLMSIAWYSYRFWNARKAKQNGNISID